MGNKRANGEGHIRKLKTGYWEARITIGYDIQTGKQKFKTFTGKTQEIVVKRLNEYKVERDKFKYNNVVKYTVKEWLLLWYDTYVIDNVKTSTRTSYLGIINNYLIPYIGNIKLVNLKKTDIEQMYKTILYNKSDKKQLTIKSVRNIRLVLHKALEDALKNEYIVKNPASIAEVPKMKNLDLKKHEIKIYSIEEQRKLINVAKEDKIYGSVVVAALYTGMRKGELLGLQWSDIDFKNRIINVNKQVGRIKNYDNKTSSKTLLCMNNYTKTENSTRRIPLIECLEEILKEHYREQQKNKSILGNKYKDNNIVFCKENGEYIDPDTLLQKYYTMVKKANITKCTFHALRHTFASRAIENKMEPKVVSSLLGHSNVQFTYKTYIHALDELKMQEMKRLNNFLRDITA